MFEHPVTASPSGNIAFGSIPDLALILLYHARRNPNDLEWQTYLDFLRRMAVGTSGYRMLVETDGGHPTRSQQQAMNEIANGNAVRVAVISHSTTARFVTSVMVLTNPDIRCFAPNQHREAYAHLGVPSAAMERTNEIRERVRNKLRLG
jgi:hypothetical protein